jgi:hypothetical protein
MTLLYIDIDGRLPRTLIERISWTCAVLRWRIVAVRIDRTRHGYHVVVGIRQRLTPPVIVAAQAILWSDWRRETFNLMRVSALHSAPKFWRDRWNVLYVRHVKPRRRINGGSTRRVPVPPPNVETRHR